MTSSREQFEYWAKQHGPQPMLHKANGGMNYSDSFIDIAWIAWQASRQCIEVDLNPIPEKAIAVCGGYGPDNYYDTIEIARSHKEVSVDGSPAMSIYLDWQISEAFEKAGIKIKGA